MKLKTQILNILLIIIAFIESISVYHKLPNQIASHWNLQGQVDGYSGKFSGAFFVPILMLGLYILFIIMPKIDPKKNISKFMDIYNLFITIFLIYMIYIHTLTLVFSLGHTFDFTRAIMPGFALLFYFIGWMLPKTKQNWFMGIRTPWTLSNDQVWTKTHILGGKLFKICAILALLGMISSKYSFYLIIIPAIFCSIYTVIYSYLEYKKIIK